MRGNKLDFAPPGLDSMVSLAIYSDFKFDGNMIFHVNIGDIYLGFGDLVSPQARR